MKQQRIAEWLQGLPSVCSVPFYNGDILEKGKKALHLKANASEKVEQNYIDNWFNLMASKLLTISEMKKTAEASLNKHINGV